MLIADHLHRPAVSQRLVEGEIESGFSRLKSCPVERAAPVVRLRAPARRANVGGPIRALLHEQELDSPVRGRLQRLLPASGGAAVPSRLLPPTREQLRLPACTPILEQGPSRIEQSRGVGMRVHCSPPYERGAHLR